MRKFLGTALSLALMYWAAAPAHAEILKNLTTSGELDVQGRSLSNVTDLNSANPDFTGAVGTRLMAGLNFDLTEDASSRVSLYKNNRNWGQTPDTLQTVQNTVQVSEANVTLKNVMGVNQTLGRQYFGDPGDLVARFGPTADYVFGLPVSAIDAWRADWNGDNMRVTAIVGKVVSSISGNFGSLSTTDSDLDLRGIEAMCTHNKAANIGAQVFDSFQSHDTFASSVPSGINVHTYVVDVKAKGEPVENLHYFIQLVRDLGNSQFFTDPGHASTASGMAILANADFKQDVGVGVVKVLGEFASGSAKGASNNDTGIRVINSDYRPGFIWGGLSAMSIPPAGLGGCNGAGLTGCTFNGQTSGITTFNAGAQFSPAQWEKLWLAGHYYYFGESQDISGAAATGKSLGNEIDLSATWKASDAVKVRFGYAWFVPGNSLKTAVGGSDTIKMGIADATVRF